MLDLPLARNENQERIMSRGERMPVHEVVAVRSEL